MKEENLNSFKWWKSIGGSCKEALIMLEEIREKKRKKYAKQKEYREKKINDKKNKFKFKKMIKEELADIKRKEEEKKRKEREKIKKERYEKYLKTLNGLKARERDRKLKNDKFRSTYFACNKDLSVIKIGFSKNIVARIKGINVCSIEEIILLGSISKNIEVELHKRFKEFRIRGEWFYTNREIINYIIKEANLTEEGLEILENNGVEISYLEADNEAR